MPKSIKSRKGSDGFHYPYTSPDLVVDKNGKSVTTKFNEIDTQFKDIAKKTIVEGNKIYLAKNDGTKLDEGTELPTGGSSEADGITIKDTAGNFTATNVEGALEELFQYASNGKNLIANAITGMGVDASSTDTFEVLAEKISQIQLNSLSVKTSQNIMYGYNGGSYVIGCMLDNEIFSDSSVPITTSSDKITVDKDSLDFTPENYSKYQKITVKNSEDCTDNTSYIMIGDKKVKLNIISKTWHGGNRGTVNCSTNDIYLVEGEKTQLKISISSTPANDQPVIISCSDPYIKISNPMFNFNVGNTDDVYVEFESTEDGVITTRESIITVQSLDAIKTIKLISIDDEVDTEGQTYGAIKLTQLGGDYLTKTDSPTGNYQKVSLESQPSDYQIVNITSDNPNIQPSQSKVVFSPTFYNYSDGGSYTITFNYVGEIDNGVNEYATITFSSNGVESKTREVVRVDTYFDGSGATEQTPTDGLMIHYDFRNITVDEGATSITINDKASNLPMTIRLANTTVESNGIIYDNYSGVDVDISSIYDELFSNINTNGLTLSYVSQKPGCMLQDNGSGKSINTYNAWQSQEGSPGISVAYFDKDNNESTINLLFNFFYDENKKRLSWIADSVVTIVLNPNGYLEGYCNNYRFFDSKKIKDFKQWNIKSFDKFKFFLSKNNRQTSYKVWNKALSHQEIMSNVLYEQSFTPIESITTTSFDEMYPNTESKVYTIITPDFKKASVTFEYSSEDVNVIFDGANVNALNTCYYTFKTCAKRITNTTLLIAENKNLNDVENLTH